LERKLLDAFAQRIPRGESVFAGNDGLGVVQREVQARKFGIARGLHRRQRTKPLPAGESDCGIIVVRGVEQIFCLPFELLEIWALG
jgi:hypothetical protein